MRKLKFINQLPSKRESPFDEPFFRALFNGSGDACFVLGMPGFVMLEVNPNGLETFHISSLGVVAGRPLFDMYAAEPVAFNRRAIEKHLDNGDIYSQELNFKTADNHIFWGSITLNPIAIGGIKYALAKIVRLNDYISSSDLIEKLVRETSKVCGKPLLKVLAGILTPAFNARYVLYAQIDKENDTARGYLYQDGKEEEKAVSFNIENSPCPHMMQGNSSFYPQQFQELFPDNTFFKEIQIESFFGIPLYNEAGEGAGIFALMGCQPLKDIPNSRLALSVFAPRISVELEKMHKEEALKDAMASLAEANRSKDRFIQMMAHDLKNSFHAILGFSELLMRRAIHMDGEKIVSTVKIIDNSLRNSYGLLENLAAWAKVQQGNIKFSPEPVDLADTMDEITELFKPAAENKNIRIISTIPDKTMVCADLNMLRAIFRNLLSNAIKFSLRQSEILISIERTDSQLSVVIEDHGVGISRKELNELMTGRASQSTMGTENEKGTGIGLSICREYTAYHKGKLELKSRKDFGTTSILTLPF